MANANISCKASNAFKKSLGGPAGAPPAAPGAPPAAPGAPPAAEEEIDFLKIVDGPLSPGQKEWLKTKGEAAWKNLTDARQKELLAMGQLAPSLTGLTEGLHGGYNRKRNKRTKRNGNKGNKGNKWNKGNKRTRRKNRKNRNKKTNKRR